jgi:hypothetical protein
MTQNTNDGSKPGVFQAFFAKQTDSPNPAPVETNDPAKPKPAAPSAPATVHHFPATMEAYLDRTVDISTLLIPLTRLPGKLRTRPDQEFICKGFAAFVAEIAPVPAPVIAPVPAPVIADKDHVPYYMALTLKAAEFINKTREKALARGESPIGKQRSSSHVDFIGPGILIDGDDDPFTLIPKLKASGFAFAIYSSYSHEQSKGDHGPKPRGRLAMAGNRRMTAAEWPWFWDGLNDLFDDKFDPAGRSAALCYGRHARRSADAPCRREIWFDGAAVNVDTVIAHGRSLRPHYDETRSKSDWKPRRKLAEELERMKLRGAVPPPDDYDKWFKWAAACKRAFANDPEGAFRLFEAYSDSGK